MAATEPAKKKRKTNNANSKVDENTEDTILDDTFVLRFKKERNDTINDCLHKLLITDEIITLIQQYSDIHLAELAHFDLFEDYDMIGYDFERLSKEVLWTHTGSRTPEIEMPEFLKECVNEIGDVIHIQSHPRVAAYIINANGKLLNIDIPIPHRIPKSISEHFNNPILYYSMFNQFSFEIDFSNLSKFISTYLFKFNINQDLITQLIEIGVPQNMECTLVFPRTTGKKWLGPYLEFIYYVYVNNYKNMKICRKFHLTENTQNEIILFHKLLDANKVCFTKCKWNTWNEETQYKNLQLLLKDVSEFGFWIEQSDERNDKSFIVKGNRDYIKDIKAIISRWTATNELVVFAQLTVTKFYGEQQNCIEENEIMLPEKKRVIFEWPYEKGVNGRRIIYIGEHVWNLCIQEHYEDRCIALLEGPLDKIAQARGIICKLNDMGFCMLDTKEIGSILEFDGTSLS